MLSGRSSKKALIKPLPPGLFTKSSFKRTSNNSFSGFDNLIVASTPPIKSTPRSSLAENKQEQSLDSIDDYTIVESDGDDEVFQDTTERRISLNSTVKRSSTSATKLSSLLASSPLNFVQKRKRKPVTPSTPVDSVKSGSLKLDGIDESSPVKKAKCVQFADQSTIFINRWKRLDKKSPHQKNREVNIPNNTTLVDQMKALIEKERTIRTVWRHSVTSQLKNKFKETTNGKETLTIRLSNFICQFHVGFANGEIIESSIKQNYKVGDTVSLIFPSILCESMGFSNGTIVQFVSPWSVIMIRNQRFIINPFWIAVIERCTLKNEKKKSDDKEETLVTWSCPCQESFGNIDPLECNRTYSQSVGFC